MGCNNSKEAGETGAIDGVSDRGGGDLGEDGSSRGAGGGRKGSASNMVSKIKEKAGHFKNVFAAPIANDDLKGFTPPVFPKSKEQEDAIRACLTSEENFIFNQLNPRELTSIINAFEIVHFEQGVNIITQGETADYYYVISEGEIAFVVNDAKVGEAKAGKSFGELALLYSCPRAATCRAESECDLFRLDQKSFRYVLQKKNVQSAEDKIGLLKKIDFLADIEHFDMQKLASAMTVVNFETEDVLVRKGEEGNAFYVIQEGMCAVTDISVGSTTYEDIQIGPGDYFGERALVTLEPRAANVIARSKGVAYSIDKDTFDTILGSLSSLILKSLDKRKLAGVKVIRDTHLEEQILNELARNFVDKTYQSGDSIMTEGLDTEATLYIVREGKVKITTRDGSREETIEEGGFFGDDQLLLDSRDRSLRKSVSANSPAKIVAKYTVVAEDKCVFGTLGLTQFRKLFDTRRMGIGRPKRTESVIARSLKLDDLKRHCMLGTGTFGQVWLVTMKKTSALFDENEAKKAFALKVQSKGELIKAHQAKGVVQEMKIMRELKHPFLLPMVKSMQDKDMVYMLLGLVQGGELFNRIHTNSQDGVSEETAKFYVAGVWDGLAYMHRRQMVYRDLKPENILIDSEGYPVVVDFGFAKKVTDKTYTFCGTPLYIPPEVILNRGHNQGADHWSLGILICELITGDTPFYREGMDQLDLYRQICSAKFEPHPLLDNRSKVIDIIGKLLTKKPSQRLGALKGGQKDIYSHPWFQGINWESFRERELKAPWIPKIKNPLDSSNFDNWDHIPDKTKQKWPKLKDSEQELFALFGL